VQLRFSSSGLVFEISNKFPDNNDDDGSGGDDYDDDDSQETIL
jgi:hypothetical protein